MMRSSTPQTHSPAALCPLPAAPMPCVIRHEALPTGAVSIGMRSHLYARPEVHVWQVRLDAKAPPPGTAEVTQLSRPERDRADRFAFAHHRVRYLQAHVALHRVLTACCAEPPGRITLCEGPQGKPALCPPHDHLCFNLSHADDWALIAVMAARWGEVGVDIESLQAAPERVAELCANVLTDEENILLDTLPVHKRGHAFITAWTRKEAVLKATGWGLRIAPDTVHTGLDAADAVVQLPPTSGNDALAVHVHPLPAPDGQHVATLAILPAKPASAGANQNIDFLHA